MYCIHFHTLHSMCCIRYIKEWCPCITRIFYNFLIIHLPEWWHPQQCLAPNTPLHHSKFNHFLNHLQILCCCQEPVSPFPHDSRLPQHRSVASVISSKTLKKFPSLPVYNQLSMQAADSKCFMEDKNNYQVNPPQLNIMCIIKHIWLLCSKICLCWHPNILR